MEERIAIIISFFAGALAAKNWTLIKKHLPFIAARLISDSDEEEDRVRVINEPQPIASKRRKRKKRKNKRLPKRAQLIKRQNQKKDSQKKPRGSSLKKKNAGVPRRRSSILKKPAHVALSIVQPKVRSQEHEISEPMITPDYNKVALPKQEQAQKTEDTPHSALHESVEPVAEPIKEFFEPADNEGREKESSHEAATDEVKPPNFFWTQFIKKENK